MPTRPHTRRGRRLRPSHVWARHVEGAQHAAPLRGYLFCLGGGLFHGHRVPALETLARRFSRRLGPDLFHPHEAAARTGDGNRFIPGRIIAVWIPQATVERPSLLRPPFREITEAALGALDAERDGLRVLALGIAHAGDVRPKAAALHFEWRATLGAFLCVQSRQVVHLVDDLVDVDRFERTVEREPEIPQYGLPVEVPFFNLVQLIFHVRREPDLEDLRERSLQHLPHRLALRGRLKATVLRGRIPARPQRGNDGRVGGWPAYPQPLQFLHQTRFAVARRRFGKVLAGHHLLERRPVALGELRNGRETVQRFRVFGLVGFAVQDVIAVEHHAGARGAEQEPPAGQLEIDLGRFIDRGRHLRREEAPPNELVELKEVAFQVFLQIVGLESYLGGPNRLVRILNLRASPAFVNVLLIRQIAFVELGVDVLARLFDGRIRHAHGVGAHVGDETDRPLLTQLHAFVQLLGGAHRAAGRETKLFGRFLLQRARRKGRRRLAAALTGRDRGDHERQLFDLHDDVARCLLGFDLGLVAGELLEPGLEWLAVLLQVGGHGPVFLRDELPDFLLALDDQPQRDGLHPTRRQAGLDALPEHRRGLVADQAVQDSPRLLRVDFALIDVEGVGQRFGDRVLGDLVKQHPPDIPISI